jgi:PadR family transcriptional regulator AphA
MQGLDLLRELAQLGVEVRRVRDAPLVGPEQRSVSLSQPAGVARVEMRDLSLLKLHLGADPATLAPAQLEAHKRTLAAYERRRAQDPGTGPRGPWLTLDAGIAHERAWVRFWTELMP